MDTLYATLLSLLVLAALFAAVLRQAGYSGWWAVLMAVPGLNLIVLGVFALREWPIVRELACRRVAAGDGDEGDCYRALAEGDRLSAVGDAEAARRIYLQIAEHPQAGDSAGDAAIRLDELAALAER